MAGGIRSASACVASRGPPAGGVDRGGGRVRGAHVRAGRGVGEGEWNVGSRAGEGEEGDGVGEAAVAWWGESGGGVGAHARRCQRATGILVGFGRDPRSAAARRRAGVWGASTWRTRHDEDTPSPRSVC